MTTVFDFLTTSSTLSNVRATLIGYWQAAGLAVTNWIKGSVGEQGLEAHVQAAYENTVIIPKAIRGFASLDTSTDPGDDDPYDSANAAQPAGPGYLSMYGANTFGTERLDQTFAKGFVLFDNTAGSGARTFKPDALIYTWTVSPPSDGKPPPTYRNSPDATIYTNIDGSVTVAAGATLTIPVTAEEVGIRSNAPANALSLTTTLLGVTGSNAAAILGSAREAAGPYRARCRLAPSSVSPNGPADAYRYIALGVRTDDLGNVFYFQTSSTTTGLGIDSDGNVVSIPNAGGVPIGFNRVDVTKSSSTGSVTVYLALPSGAPSGGDVTNYTNLVNAIYWPDATTRSISGATATTVAVTYTAKAKAAPGVTSGAVQAAVEAALEAAFELFDIGGYDQTAGAGTLYADLIKSIIEKAHPAIYHVTLAAPSGDVSLAAGHVAVLGVITPTITIV